MDGKEKEEKKEIEGDEENEESEDNEENENLRELILEQLANLEQSDVSDDGSYKVRLSCILEDDESESSGAYQKDSMKSSERNKESEKGPPKEVQDLSVAQLSGDIYCSENSDDFKGETIQVTDLDDDTLVEVTIDEKTEQPIEVEKVDENASEESDEFGKREAFPIKKLKSSDNVHRRPFVVRRRELSSDSSDLDISVTNSAEGVPSDVKIVEINEVDDENTLNAAPDIPGIESEASADEEPESKSKNDLEVVDNETLSSIFAKVSKTYLEKTKGHVKWEENEKIDTNFAVVKERSRSRERQPTEDHLALQDVHIRGTSPKQYNPPIPPETYLWEELKRLRERGGYPWTYLDKPPFDEATWKKYMEHVYEPINPPPPSTETSLSVDKLTDLPSSSLSSLKGSTSIPEIDKQIVRIPSENEIPKTEKYFTDDAEDKEVEMISSAQIVQDKTQENFLREPALTPTEPPVPSTSPSFSTTELPANTVDSSASKDLSIKHPTLSKTRREQIRAQAQDFQQKLRNQAGRIRTKLNSMQHPTFQRKNASDGEKSKFRFPEMHAPKINFPDPSKFKFPERPKFHLPESKRFHLPDKSKFHLPERPKFNLSEKIHLPDKGKFHFPDTSKFHLPDRAKFRLPDRAKFHLPEKAKFHLPDRSKFHLPDRAKFQLPERAKFNRPKLEMPKFGRHKDVESPSGSPTNKFDIKSYSKLFTKHSKDYTTSSPKQTRGRTPPPRMMEVETPPEKNSDKWMRKLEDLQYADDDDLEEDMKETDSRKSESLFDYREKDMGYGDDFKKEREEEEEVEEEDLEENVAKGRLYRECREYQSSDDRKKGVLEEINSDEFFLRQKGISQDDIDMGKYLSHEIREAFRSPDVNALAKMDYTYDENVDPKYKLEPDRPTRLNSTKIKSILKKTSTSDPAIADDGCKTYPRRSGKKSRSQSKSLLNEEVIISERMAYYERETATSGANVGRQDADDPNVSRYDNVEYDEDNVSEYYKIPGPAKEYDYYKVPRSHGVVAPSPSVKRKSSENEISIEKIHDDLWNDDESTKEPPVPVARKKNKKNKMKAEKSETDKEEQIPQEYIVQSEEAVLQLPERETPIPPKRTRSSGSRSLIMEKEGSRSFQSEMERERLEIEFVIEELRPIEDNLIRSVSEFMTYKAPVHEITDLDDVGFGYATVGKPTVTKPQRQKKKEKPERPPPPRRKKETFVPIYNTYPRRTPVRPLRNYSTLGPSRPPRRKKITSKGQSLAEKPSKTYSEIQSGDSQEVFVLTEVSESVKDLQTDKVIEKMKGRPLPPPPRPPRQKSKGPEDEETSKEEQISLGYFGDEEFLVERQVTAFVHEPFMEKESVEETSASIHKDTLPDDFLEKENDIDAIQEFSHEQLEIQQAFLDEMKREQQELRQKGMVNDSDLVDVELKAEVIRQIEDMIAEEKRLLERRNKEETASTKEDQIQIEEKNEEEQTEISQPVEADNLDVDVDMGYASLDRRGYRHQPQEQSLNSQDPISEPPPQIPPKMNKLQVKELEAETINVHEVQADQIFVKELQSNRVASQDIDNTGGNVVLGNVNLPSSFIDQIVAKIPWESLRESHDRNHVQVRSDDQNQKKPEPQDVQRTLSPPTRPQRRHRPSQPQDDSDDEAFFQPRRTHRRHRRTPTYTTEEEEDARQKRQGREKSSEASENITELSIQLARACTAAGVQAVSNFIEANAAFARSLDREMVVQAVLCIAVALVAAYFLFGFDAKITYLHRWDFQFPPQPPPNSRI